MGVRADVCHCPRTGGVFGSEWLEWADARTDRNRTALTLKHLFILPSSHKQRTVLCTFLHKETSLFETIVLLCTVH